MSRHWKPDANVTGVRPARRGARVHALSELTPWTSPESYVPAPPATWPDGLKVAAVLAAGACVFLAAGFAQAL